MTHTHRCPGEGCGFCQAHIDRIEDERIGGRPEGYSERDLDRLADGAGADMVYGRD